MRLIYLLILLIGTETSFAQTECERYKDKYVPTDLDDALRYLTCVWSDKGKEEFKNKVEKHAVAELHFGTGLQMRNGWGLWEGKNSLTQYFNSKGVFHPDDISSIILTSFHRQLNNKDIGLENQIQLYKDYWEKSKTLEKIDFQSKKELKEEFRSFKVGDKVSMEFTKDNNTDKLLLNKVEKLPEWELDRTTCIVKGIVVKKKKIKDNNYVLIIEPTDICGSQMAHLGNNNNQNLVVGQKFEYNISQYNITRD
jgi:hypothetical protein